MAKSYDVWLVRLEKRDAATLMAVARRFGVDASAARHIVAQLPRLVSVDVSSTIAEGVARDLRKMGGVAHIARTGEKPDFEGESAQTSAAPPKRTKPIKRSAKDEAARAKRSKDDDAASLRWPDDDEQERAWNPNPKQPPPPVPRPIRNSAARVLALTLTVAGVAVAGAATWWFTVGVEERSWASARFETPDAGVALRPEPPEAAAEALEPSSPDLELAKGLKASLEADAWTGLVEAVSAGLDDEPRPFAIQGVPVGVTFSVRTRETLRLFKQLHPEVRAAGASLFRVERGDTVKPDRVALVPLDGAAQVIRLFGTAGSGQGVSNDDIQAWLTALGRKQPFFLMGAGPDFLQGRFEVGVRNESVLSEPIYRCPGEGEESEEATGTSIDTLNALRKGERFSCEFR